MRIPIVVSFCVVASACGACEPRKGGHGGGVRPVSCAPVSESGPPPAGTRSVATTTTAAGGHHGGELAGCRVFPSDNAWNLDVSGHPIHPRSDLFVDSIGRGRNLHPDFGTVWRGMPMGIPFMTVKGDTVKVPIYFTDYPEESDPGPYPIPTNAPVEGGPDADGDRHVIVLDTDNCMLYEMFYAWPKNDGSWKASSGAVWNLNTNESHPEGWTSADAAGLPILPGLVRYDEVVEKGEIRHALRFTVERTQRGYIAPATHFASRSHDPRLPPMGLRLRMKADYDCSGLSKEAQVVCTALKKYGMIVADNGGNWFISGTPDERWDDDAVRDLKQITGDAFEAVDTGPITRG